MKKTVLAIAAVVTMSGAAGYTGHEIGQEKAFEQATNQMEMQTAQMSKALQEMKYLTVKNIKEIQTLQRETGAETVSEKFTITSIDENNVRGELVEGTGEGIYYPIEFLASHGADKLELGDKVELTWTLENFNNGDWYVVESVTELH